MKNTKSGGLGFTVRPLDEEHVAPIIGTGRSERGHWGSRWNRDWCIAFQLDTSGFGNLVRSHMPPPEERRYEAAYVDDAVTTGWSATLVIAHS